MPWIKLSAELCSLSQFFSSTFHLEISISRIEFGVNGHFDTNVFLHHSKLVMQHYVMCVNYFQLLYVFLSPTSPRLVHSNNSDANEQTNYKKNHK